MTKSRKIFVLLGGARTFLECFESFCSRMLLNLFEKNTKENTFVLLYLKCDDPGPKNQKPFKSGQNFNFKYPEVTPEEIHLLIDKMERRYENIQFVRKIITTNEKTDEELFRLIPKRELYFDWLKSDVQLKRALQQAYNYQRCDELISEIEKENNIQFDFYITVRPDLYFIKDFKDISKYYENKNRPMDKVLGCHDVFFFIPRQVRKGLRVIDFVSKNTTVKMRVTEQLQWGAQGQPLWGNPWPINIDVSTRYFLMKRPDGFYTPLVSTPCDPPTEFTKERYKNYLDLPEDWYELIDNQLIDKNNKIILNELEGIFGGFDSVNIIAKGDTAKQITTENTIGINQSLRFTNYKYSFMNDFESLFGIEKLICKIKYLFIPSYPHVNNGHQKIKFTTILDFLRMYNFNGKIFIYELNTSKERGALKEYNLHELDTTQTSIKFFKKFFTNIKKFNLYGCYKSNYYHEDLLKLNLELNKDNKYGVYIDDYVEIYNRAKVRGRQNFEERLKNLNVEYVLN